MILNIVYGNDPLMCF